jgi:hypothetical protein
MMQLKHSWTAHWLMGGALALMGCALALTGCGGGGDDGDDEPELGDGTVTEEWAGFCTGTFTEDTPIVDPFGETAFTAQAGEEYLLSDFDDTFGARAEFLYLTNVGPDSFEVEPSAEGAWPFTSNCTIGEGVAYYAVFDDVSVFSDEELTTKICDLSAGSALPAGGSGRGYAFTGSRGDSAIYEVILGPFSAECGDQGLGYISVPQTRSFGSTTWLVPIAGILSPE